MIRLRGDIYVTNARGERRLAAAWVGAGGRARRLVGARVTDAHELPVGVVVCVHDRKMDEPWCLAASEATVPTPVLIRYYGKRWGIDLWQNRCYKSPDNRLCLSTGSGGALGGPFIVTEPPPPQTPPGGVGLTRRWVKKLVHIFPLPVLAAFAPRGTRRCSGAGMARPSTDLLSMYRRSRQTSCPQPFVALRRSGMPIHRALVAYIVAFAVATTLILATGSTASAQSVDIQAGERTFQSVCLSCHGTAATAATAGPDFSATRFSRVRNRDDLVDVIRRGIPGTSMPALPSPPGYDNPATRCLHRVADQQV